MPFGGPDLFARIVNPSHTHVATAPTRSHNGRKATYCRDGQLYARVRVPRGGVGRIQVGITEWSDGRVDHGWFIVSCSRGSTTSSNSLHRNRAGTWRLPTISRPDSCTVITLLGGSGKIAVEIRAV